MNRKLVQQQIVAESDNSQCFSSTNVCFQQQELGDVENWAKTIEKDMRTITTALEVAYKIERE